MARTADLKFQALGVLLVLFYSTLSLFAALLSIARNPSKALTKRRRIIPPSCLLDPSLGIHEYVTANGIKFHYVTAGDKTKPLMLFLHGFPEFWYSWRFQMREFCHDYHVVAVDMRGYGETDKPPLTSDYHIQKLAQDVAQLVPALGHKKCVLVGHDWGGAVAWYVAQEFPQVIWRLIVMNVPHSKVMMQEFKKGWKQLRMSYYCFAFQTPWLPEFMFGLYDYAIFNRVFRGADGLKNRITMTREGLEAYKYVFSQPGALTPPINYYRNMMSYSEPKNEQINLPTLLIWGDSDIYLSSSMADEHTMVCSNIVIKHIPNCSHWVQQDNPVLVNQYMRKFLLKVGQ